MWFIVPTATATVAASTSTSTATATATATAAATDLHLLNLKDKSIFKIIKIVTLSQFIPLILFERNLSTVALISPLKRQGARDLANQPVAGAALLFSFDNHDNSTAVLIVRQRIPIAGILNSRTITFVETKNIGNTPIKCKGVVVTYCSSR